MAVISAVYGDSFAAGARAGIADLAPLLARRRPDAAARRPRAARRRDARPAVRQVGARHGLRGTSPPAPRERPLCEALGAPLRRRRRRSTTSSPCCRSSRRWRSRGSSWPRATAGIQVKVGTTPEADAERLAAVREAVGNDVVLYADANGAFTAGGARRFLRATRELEYVARAAVPHLRRVRLGPPREPTGRSSSTSRS